MHAVQQPISLSTFEDVMGVPAWRDLPTWFMVATNDEAIPPDAERQFAARMGATTVEVASSHVPMVSQPDEVVALIEAAVAGVSALGAGRRLGRAPAAPGPSWRYAEVADDPGTRSGSSGSRPGLPGTSGVRPEVEVGAPGHHREVELEPLAAPRRCEPLQQGRARCGAVPCSSHRSRGSRRARAVAVLDVGPHGLHRAHLRQQDGRGLLADAGHARAGCRWRRRAARRTPGSAPRRRRTSRAGGPG